MAKQRISADLIIPGTGTPIPNGVVIIKNGVIDFVGTKSDEPVMSGEYALDIQVPVLMPGMWDCHVHFMGASDIAYASNPGKELIDIAALTPVPIAVGRCMNFLNTLIEYGITSVREVGGFGLYLKKLVNEGSIPGPNVYSCGKFLGIIGGHTDVHGLSDYHIISSEFRNVFQITKVNRTACRLSTPWNATQPPSELDLSFERVRRIRLSRHGKR